MKQYYMATVGGTLHWRTVCSLFSSLSFMGTFVKHYLDIVSNKVR